MKFILYVALIQCLAGHLFAYEVPTDNNVIKIFNQVSPQEFPTNQTLSVLVWNLHKGEDGGAWAQDFSTLTQSSHLLFLQEVWLSELVKNTFTSLRSWEWISYTSFIYDGYDTGVGIGTTVQPQSLSFLRSPDREPIANTPKITGLARFNLKGSTQTLLVASLHAINFTTLSPFMNQVNDVMNELSKHQGPIILAGDFNTWNSGRMDYLLSQVRKIGLRQVSFANDHRSNVLDHVFVRGMKVSNATILTEVTTSDHQPLRLEIEINN